MLAWYVPVPQGVATFIPVVGHMFPTGHGSQVDCPPFGWYLPMAQSVTAVAVGPGHFDPAVQSVQAVALVPLYLPAPHSVCVVLEQ